MIKKFYFIPLIFCVILLIPHSALANERMAAMDKALEKISHDYAKDDSIGEVKEFVLNNTPKEVVNVEADTITVERPLTQREIEKRQKYQERKKMLNGAVFTKLQNLKKNIDARFHMSMGYRFDKVKWNIAASGGTPNILSELTWDKQKSKQLTLKGDFLAFERYVFDVHYSIGNIIDGSVRDSDYALNDRQGEFSRSVSDTEGGDVYDAMFALGYRMNIDDQGILKKANCDELSVTFLGGYSIHEQDLVAKKGEQIVPATGYAGLETLHSEYLTEWKGPWLGFALEGRRRKLTGIFRYQYHIADYYAVADWNLRTDFQHPKSFEHESTARGFRFDFGTNYHINEDFTLDFNLNFQKWEAKAGVDRIFFSSGTVTETRLNEVLWDSYAFMFGGTYHFK